MRRVGRAGCWLMIILLSVFIIGVLVLIYQINQPAPGKFIETLF